MAYAVIADVQGLNPKRTYSTSSKPTTTQVTSMIDDIASEIDVALAGRGLTVPLTAPAELLAYVTHLNALGAGALAEQAMFPQGLQPGLTPHANVMWKQYMQGLEEIRTGNLPTGSEASSEPFSFLEDNQATGTEPSETYKWTRPKFRINKDF